MDSLQKLLSSGKPVLSGWTKEGLVYVVIKKCLYEYAIDAALIPRLRKGMLKNPWSELNWLKKNCYSWRKLY